MENIYEEILSYVADLEIIDTHEHLPPSESARDKDRDVLEEYLSQYFKRDLFSAGLKKEEYQKIVDNRYSLLERWEMVEPYWELARNTGYGRSLDISVRGIYGFNRIDGSTIEELNERFKDSLKPGHFHIVLKEKSRIFISLLDSDSSFNSDLACESEFFKSVYRLDKFISPGTVNEVREIEEFSGINIRSLDDWLEACEVTLDKILNRGAVALKCGLAYLRPLKFEMRTRKAAEESFNKIFQHSHIPDWQDQVFNLDYAFQDYMMHYILRLAEQKKLVFQFHTGIQQGSGNLLYNSDPALLSNLFIQYPGVKFDILHVGYPYQRVLSVLAKNFPNVYIDMCWAHIISPTAVVNGLVEWLDTVPVNKISAFGGDHSYIDAVYGHQYLARVNISRSLARKVYQGVFDTGRALEIAERLFFKNPLELFGLEENAAKLQKGV